MSKQIEHVQFVSTLSKGRNFTIESFDIVAVCGNKVECCFDKVERCFDIVAGVDRALDSFVSFTGNTASVIVVCYTLCHKVNKTFYFLS